MQIYKTINKKATTKPSTLSLYKVLFQRLPLNNNYQTLLMQSRLINKQTTTKNPLSLLCTISMTAFNYQTILMQVTPL